MADKDGMERKVYLLPTDLVERIKAYQSASNISSEVEAARRLLSEALQARDSLDDIMKQVRAYFRQDHDLRALAREVLTGHILVSRVDISDRDLVFVLRNSDAGKISSKGELLTGQANDEGYIYSWDKWEPPQSASQNRSPAAKPNKSQWDSPDLEDEIPF